MPIDFYHTPKTEIHYNITEKSCSDQLDKIKNTMKSSTGHRALQKAKEFLDNHVLSNSQIKQLIDCLNFDSDKLILAEYAYKSSTDKYSYVDQVKQSLTFLSHRRELEDRFKYIAEYQILMKKMRSTSSTTGLKMAKEFLANYVLENSEIHQLITCLRCDCDRLELAKYAYKSSADKKSYFKEIKDSLIFLMSKDKLEKFIKSQ